MTRTFHSTRYVDTLMRRDGLRSAGHDIGDKFTVGPANASVRVTVTPADHDWQNAFPGAAQPGAHHFRKETPPATGSRRQTARSGRRATRASSPSIT